MTKLFFGFCCLFFNLGFVTLQAQEAPAFKTEADSLWFFEQMPFPQIDFGITFYLKPAMMDLLGPKQRDTSELPVLRADLPKDLEDLQAFFRKNPSDALAAFLIFERFTEKGDADVGETYLKRAIELYASRGVIQGELPALRRATELLLFFYGNKGGWNNVKELFKNYVQKHQGVEAFWLFQADCALVQGDTAACIEAMDSLIILNPLSPDLYEIIIRYEMSRTQPRMMAYLETDTILAKDLSLRLLPSTLDYTRIDALIKAHKKAVLPQFSRDMMGFMDLILRLMSYNSTAVLPFSSLAGQFRENFVIPKPELKLLKTYEKQFKQWAKRKDIVEPYLIHRNLMLIAALFNQPQEASLQHEKAAGRRVAQYDLHLHRMAGLSHLIFKRDYSTYASYLRRDRPSWKADESLLYAKILFHANLMDSCTGFLLSVLEKHLSVEAVMGLTVISFKQNRLADAYGYLKAVAGLEAEHPLRNNSIFYFYLSLGLILDKRPEEAAPILKQLVEQGGYYSVFAKAYQAKFCP